MNVKYYIERRLIFDFDADNFKDVFGMIAEAQEIFEAGPCGQCGGREIHCRVRTVNKNDFYELLCVACQATLPLGQTKDGKGLFPKKDKSKTQGWQPPYERDQQPEYAAGR